MAAKKYELDLWKTLEAIDKRKFKFYANLSEEEKKKFPGIVILRWMSAVSGSRDLKEYSILSINETANKHFWNSALKDHPELQYLTMARAGSGMKMRHEWIKAPSKKSSNKVFDFLRRYYPTASKDELEMFLQMNTPEELFDLAKMMGMQDQELKELKKEIKKIK